MWTSGKSMYSGRVRTRKLTKAPRVVGWTLGSFGWLAGWLQVEVEERCWTDLD
jgi:hypothetical protein